MKKPLGNFIVLFKPGVVTGIYNAREKTLKYICEQLGGFDCKVFDPYLTYAKLADAGLMVRIEQRNQYGFGAVSFFYPAGENEREVRKKITNAILSEIQNDCLLFTNGFAVASDKKGNLRLVAGRPQQNTKPTPLYPKAQLS